LPPPTPPAAKSGWFSAVFYFQPFFRCNDHRQSRSIRHVPVQVNPHRTTLDSAQSIQLSERIREFSTIPADFSVYLFR